MGRSGMFVTFDEALALVSVSEEKLKRLVSEGEIRAFRNGDEMKFRLTDVCALVSEMFLPAPTENPVIEFHWTPIAQKIGITPDQLSAAIGHRLIPFGRVERTSCAIPDAWVSFWVREREGNTERWRDFLEVLSRPQSVTEHPHCAHGRVIGVAPCPYCTEIADNEDAEIVGSSDGDGIRPTGCCLAIAFFAMKIGSGALIGAALASTLLA